MIEFPGFSWSDLAFGDVANAVFVFEHAKLDAGRDFLIGRLADPLFDGSSGQTTFPAARMFDC